MLTRTLFIRFFRRPRALALLGAGALACSSILMAQNTVQTTPPRGASSSVPNADKINPSPEQSTAPVQRPPAVIDPTGPAISMETSEALFDVMAGLNACGYDQELAISDPVRQKIRDLMDQALAQSEAAREARDNLCAFVHKRTLGDPRRNLAQYVSLALYLNPPPDLSQSVPTTEMPPDAEPIVDYVPLLRSFADAVNLHLIWALERQAYDEEVSKLHAPLTKMILDVDLYLKQPPSGYSDRRFLVLLEPQIAPGQTNARVYGSDYVVVASPVNGVLRMNEIKHTYLHFELEPLLYARSEAIDKLLPLLERVQDAPIPLSDKGDIVALVTECMIRAIEARTMDTGVPPYVPPAHIDRSQLAAINNKINAHDKQVAAVRQAYVDKSMTQGYILTQYFYNQFGRFEQGPISLEEAVGEMVYGMNVQVEKNRVQYLVFTDHQDEDVLERPAPTPDLLDQAEQALANGDTAQAVQLANQALAQHTHQPGRAQFILARADILDNKVDAAVTAFQQAAQLSHDPRTISWSHIYLGRIYDVQDNRDGAVAQYQAALQSRDGRPDTKQAAEQGLKRPFGPPHATKSEDAGPNGPDANGPDAPAQKQGLPAAPQSSATSTGGPDKTPE
ncbi:MAG: tetratricopeptide repeat protein [Acidobacteriaceae bacterium]